MYRLTTARRIAQLWGTDACHTPSRLYSSTPHFINNNHNLPPTLIQLKKDLKVAMRARDHSRLIVVRSVLAAHHNASKTPTPITTEGQLVALMRKLLKASRDAVAEAKAAGREDLAVKEKAEADILGGYIAGSRVEKLTEEELRKAVGEAVDAAKAKGDSKSLMGNVMKSLSTSLRRTNVDMKAVAALVKEMTSP